MFRHSLGHCHPTVVKAVQEQAANLSHGQVNIFYQKPMLDLIKGLLPKMPSSKLDTFFFGTQVLKQSKPLSNSPVMPPKSKTSLCFKDPITAVPLVRWLWQHQKQSIVPVSLLWCLVYMSRPILTFSSGQLIRLTPRLLRPSGVERKPFINLSSC